MNVIKKLKPKHKWILFCSVISFITLLCTSLNSPLYGFNNTPDTNCFSIVAKMLLNGKVLYKDIYEHKGPLMYFIYIPLVLIKGHLAESLFILENIIFSLFLYYAHKTLDLLQAGVKKQMIILYIISLLIPGSAAFALNGSAEEICLPLFMWMIYTVTKSISDKAIIPFNKVFFLGVISAVIFWIKYNLLGMFIGAILFTVGWYIHLKQTKKLLPTIFVFIIGFIVPTIPVILYSALTNSLSDLWQVYFYNLIFKYTSYDDAIVDSGGVIIHSKVLRLLYNAGVCYINNIWSGLFLIQCFVLLMFALVHILAKKKIPSNARVWFFLSCFISFTIFTFMGIYKFSYYALPLAALLPYTLSEAGRCLIENHKCKLSIKKRRMLTGAGITFIAFSPALLTVFCFNSDNLQINKKGCIQTEFTTIMQEDSKGEEYSLYVFDCDSGFYEASGKVPEYKYFYNTNLKSIVVKQLHYMNTEPTDYIISWFDVPEIMNNFKKYDESINENDFNYEVIETRQIYDKKTNKDRIYYLYKKKDV